jgi:hypothetical protein
MKLKPVPPIALEYLQRDDKKGLVVRMPLTA